MNARHITALLLLTLCGTATARDTLVLGNGDTLSGSVERIEPDTLVWISPILGTLRVPRADVATVNGNALPPVAETTQIAPQAAMTPVDEPIVFDGSFDMGFERNLGATDSEEIDMQLRAALEHGRLTHRLNGQFEYEARRGLVTEEDYELEYQVERYANRVGRGRYSYARLAWNKDRFRATDEWAAVGVGLGHVWRPGEATRIRAQAGIDQWWFSLQNDRVSEPGGRLLFDFRHTFERLARLSVFSELQVITELGGDDNRVIETTTGIRVPLSERFFTQLSVDYDRFESIDVPEFSDNDETEWHFRLGYQW